MRASSTPPAPPRTGMPRSSKNTQNGCPKTPNTSHEAPVSSQTTGKEKGPSVSTKAFASSRLSRAPIPTKLSSGLSRANCSTAGASARQSGQCGAQNHASSGPASSNESRLIVAPDARSTTWADGRLIEGEADIAVAVGDTCVATGVVVAGDGTSVGAGTSGDSGSDATTELSSDVADSSAAPQAPVRRVKPTSSASASRESLKEDRGGSAPGVCIRWRQVRLHPAQRVQVQAPRKQPEDPASCRGTIQRSQFGWPPTPAWMCTACRYA